MTRRRGRRRLPPRRYWTPAEERRLRKLYPKRPTSELAVLFGRPLTSIYQKAIKMGLRKTAEYLSSPAACRLRRGGNVGAATRFQKGHVPANKGLRRPGWAPGRMSETQFKPGQRGSRWVPVGAERVTKDGYLQRKIRDTPFWVDNWRNVHELLWEEHHGPVPPGFALCFRNGDKSDVRIENLECIPRSELMRRNTVHNLPKPLAQVVQLRGALNRQINRRSRA